MIIIFIIFMRIIFFLFPFILLIILSRNEAAADLFLYLTPLWLYLTFFLVFLSDEMTEVREYAYRCWFRESAWKGIKRAMRRASYVMLALIGFGLFFFVAASVFR